MNHAELINNFDCYAFYKESRTMDSFSLLRYEIRSMFAKMKIDHLFSCNKEVISNGDEVNCIVPSRNSDLQFKPIPIHEFSSDLKHKRWQYYERAKHEALILLGSLGKE